jgi:N-acetyl-anhydromuramyl-L-alanine amidase AmpD
MEADRNVHAPSLPDPEIRPVLVQPVTAAPTNTAPAPRTGDEIVIAGQLFHTGTRVVLWTDTNGYNAYGLERHFTPANPAMAQDIPDDADAQRPRYDERRCELTAEEREGVRARGWDLPLVQRHVDQFVIHYDVAGTSRQCFYVLHDRRFLSVHFMLDLDGTIYQTLDVKERARHASTANDRSVGIEIANIGAYPTNDTRALDEWHQRDTNGRTLIKIPARFGDGGLLTTNFTAQPARADAITNEVQGRVLVQYDFTPEQYAALAHLTAALCRALPNIKCDAPRDDAGNVAAEILPDEELENYRGLLGHFHLTTNKVDPGPAFQWDNVIGGARRLLEEGEKAGPANPP